MSAVHFRRPDVDGVPQPIECGQRPILGGETGDTTTSERDAATCVACRRIGQLADAAAMAHGCNRPTEHRGTARGRYYGEELGRVRPAESCDDD